MKTFILAILMAVCAPLAWAQDAGEVLGARWVDPTKALYNMSCSTERQQLDDRGDIQTIPVHDFSWYGIDYASFLFAETGMLWVQAKILEAWGQLAADGDATYKALIDKSAADFPVGGTPTP